MHPYGELIDDFLNHETEEKLIGEILDLAKAVVKIKMYCHPEGHTDVTGFLISKSTPLLLTANHVLPNLNAIKSSYLWFDYNSEDDNPFEYSLENAKREEFNLKLDYTILQLNEKIPNDTTFIDLGESVSPNEHLYQPLRLIHFPLIHSGKRGKYLLLPFQRLKWYEKRRHWEKIINKDYIEIKDKEEIIPLFGKLEIEFRSLLDDWILFGYGYTHNNWKFTYSGSSGSPIFLGKKIVGIHRIASSDDFEQTKIALSVSSLIQNLSNNLKKILNVNPTK